jgi:hypothetical protein
MPNTRHAVVEREAYAGRDYVVVNLATGDTASVVGLPVSSPDGRRFALASTDVEGHELPNVVEVWRLTSGGVPVREYASDGRSSEVTAWGPDSVTWRDTTSLFFVQRPALTSDGRPRTSRRVKRLSAGADGWTISDVSTSP